jgi:hypothetical protein
MKHVSVNRIIQSLYLLLAALLFMPLRHYLDCNDTLQYITLAKKYAAGDLMQAISSYWSPLLSWILVPFIKFGLEGFFVLKIIQILIGWAALFFICKLTDHRQGIGQTGLFFKLAAVPLIASFALLNGTPDLLALLWMLWLLSILSEPEKYFSSIKFALICGLVGGLLYFSKAAGFFFFLILFTVLHLYYFFLKKESDRNRTIRFFICGTGTFLFTSALWICLLSNAYGKFTFSSSGTYNFGIIGPALNPDVYGELNHPFYMGKLFEPSNKSALNAWENPTTAFVPHWSPFHSKTELRHYLRVIWKNLRSLQSYNFGADPGSVLILGWMLLLYFDRKQAVEFFRRNILLIIFPVILSLLYILVFVNHRYIWLNDCVILILAADLCGRLAQSKKGAAIAFASAFLLLVSYQSWGDIHPRLNDGKANWQAGKAFAAFDPLPGSVASLTSDMTYSYDYCSLVCYLSVKNYKGILDTRKQDDISSELEKFHVKYIFTWGTAPDPILLTHGRAKFLLRYPEARLSIYSFQ